MLPCNYEDSRVSVYVQDPLQKGACDILVNTVVDTDVVVILVGAYFYFHEYFLICGFWHWKAF